MGQDESVAAPLKDRKGGLGTWDAHLPRTARTIFELPDAGRGSGYGHLLTSRSPSHTVTAHSAREVERAGRAHHGLVQVGHAPGAAAMGGGGELGRSAEVAAIVLGHRLHQVDVVPVAVLEGQLVAHGNAVRAGVLVHGRPELGAGADGHGGCGDRERGGGVVECRIS